MALHGKEKIWFLVNRIQDEREITPSGQPILLHPTQDLHNNYEMQDVVNLLNKLEKEEKAAKLLSLPTDQTFLKYQIKILPGFDKYLDKLLEDPDYQDWSGKKPKPKTTGFKFGNIVDFSKSSKQNEDKYISVGKIQELMKTPEAERQKIMKNSLTEKHRKDVEEYEKSAAELVKNFQANFKMPDIKLPNFNSLTEIEAILPPNYEAEQVRLLRQIANQQETQKEADKKQERVFTITYTNSRQVLLNSIFELAKPNFDSENDLVFGFLYKNPNKSFSKKAIEQELNINITKDFHKIVENLGFKGDLAKIFFSAAKNSIMFRNPVSAAELEEMGIATVRLR